MLAVVKLIKTEAMFIIGHLYPEDRRIFLILAHDEGMMNGEYIFYGETVGSSIANPVYRPEIDIYELLVGFLAVQPPQIGGAGWERLAEGVLAAYDDPHFAGHKRVDGVQDISPFAGKVTCGLLTHYSRICPKRPSLIRDKGAHLGQVASWDRVG